MIILVVDDDSGTRECLKLELEDAGRGYRVVLAATGEEAWSFVQNLPPDLLITDINMPGMDGLQLLQKVKAACPDVPVVLISSEPPISELAALQLGAAALLIKDCLETRLVELVRTLAA